MTEEVTYAQTN